MSWTRDTARDALKTSDPLRFAVSPMIFRSKCTDIFLNEVLVQLVACCVLFQRPPFLTSSPVVESIPLISVRVATFNR